MAAKLRYLPSLTLTPFGLAPFGCAQGKQGKPLPSHD